MENIENKEIINNDEKDKGDTIKISELDAIINKKVADQVDKFINEFIKNNEANETKNNNDNKETKKGELDEWVI